MFGIKTFAILFWTRIWLKIWNFGDLALSAWRVTYWSYSGSKSKTRVKMTKLPSLWALWHKMVVLGTKTIRRQVLHFILASDLGFGLPGMTGRRSIDRCWSLLENHGMWHIVRNVLGRQSQILYYLWPDLAHKDIWLSSQCSESSCPCSKVMEDCSKITTWRSITRDTSFESPENAAVGGLLYI